MILGPESRLVLSSLGWVDRGSVWRLDSATGEQDAFVVSDADYLKLFDGDRERFVVQHYWRAHRFRVTAHAWNDPEVAISSINVSGWVPRIEGDVSVWATLPTLYVGVLGGDETGAGGVYVLSVRDAAATVERVDWFGDDYDHAYQTVVSVVDLPGTSERLFSVARSSDLVLVDAVDGLPVRRVPLAGRSGNPKLVVSARGPAVWTTDYDTVVRLDRSTWQVTSSARLQPSSAGSDSFVGDVWLPAEESCLLVPRPRSGDVVVVDSATLTVLDVVELGQQPLVAVLTDDGRVVARDWKSGDTLIGSRARTRSRWRRRRPRDP